MKISRRRFGGLAAGTAMMLGGGWRFAAQAAEAEGDVIRSHGDSLIGPLKYAEGFPHFNYVNPAAPKGGVARLDASGGFDSFHSFISKGDPATGLGLISDTLMTPSLDGGSEHYGLLAEWMERPEDYSWVAFKLRDSARWHDGTPVTVDDVIFAFDMLTTKGAPFYKSYYQNVVKAEDVCDGVVRFTLDQSGNRELPHIMGQLTPLPKHWWEGRDFEKSSLDIPLGSGAYKIGKFEAGRFVEYERVADYWGADLPVNIGANNFDVLRFDYFKDDSAALDGFKAGDFDYRAENSARNWATSYDFPALQRGEAVKREVVLEGPKSVQFYALNMRLPKFGDRRTREAIGLAFDFEWTNKTIFYDQYARPGSYFQGSTELMATGIPEGAELAMLAEFRDQLPPELFEKPFELPKTDGDGRPRQNLRAARKLLQDAGWQVKGGKLLGADGEQLSIVFTTAQKSMERVMSPFVKNLESLGIDARIRVVDSAQYVRLWQDHDFDVIVHGVSNSESPGNEQREYWGSETADRVGSRNQSGVKNPVVDALIEKIVFAADRAELEAASRALDRVLLWEHVAIPMLYTPFERIAYWTRIQPPEPLPARSIGFPTVWWSAGA